MSVVVTRSIRPALFLTMVFTSSLGLSGKLLAQMNDSVYFNYQLRNGKEQQLIWTELPRALKLYGEVRGRTEGQPSYGFQASNDRTYELTRIRGGVETNIDPRLRATLAFQDTHVPGLPGSSANPTFRDQFDLFTGNIDLHWQDRVHLVAGRQQLTFGSEHLVGVSDWANNSRSWDGFKARVGSATSLEIFSTSVVKQHPTSLDKHGSGLTFHGVVATIPVKTPQLKVQPFLYLLALPHVLSPEPSPGAELETTFAAEISGMEDSGFEFDILAAFQRGSRGPYAISAEATSVRAAWLFRHTRLKPRLVGEFDYATGDDGCNKGRTGTFDQLYASNHGKFGLTDLFGLQNLVQTQGNLDVSPVRNATIRLEGEVLSLANRRDSVYRTDGSVLRAVPQGGFRIGRLGSGVDLSGTYVYHQYLLIEAGCGHLFPSRGFAQTADAPATTVGYLQISYKVRFRKDSSPDAK